MGKLDFRIKTLSAKKQNSFLIDLEQNSQYLALVGSPSGGLLDFHPAEVQARLKMKEHSSKSILVLDSSKFIRHAPAAGDNITNLDLVICDNPGPTPTSNLILSLKNKIIFAEQETETL